MGTRVGGIAVCTKWCADVTVGAAIYVLTGGKTLLTRMQTTAFAVCSFDTL